MCDQFAFPLSSFVFSFKKMEAGLCVVYLCAFKIEMKNNVSRIVNVIFNFLGF